MCAIFSYLFLFYLTTVECEPLKKVEEQTKILLNQTRRILRGHDVGETRPYMVYLRPAAPLNPNLGENWLCGGVIIHELYVLTSAACIEDAKHFYVVSGTHRWVPLSEQTDCIKNGAKKAIWKCVHLSYFFDGAEFDNIHWMVHDIAIVKVEDAFNFEKRVKGCDFIPQKISYNNQSEELEKPGTTASIAGWGSTESFVNVERSSINSPLLLEADVILISKRNCKKRWPEQYHHIIDENMICGKDGLDSDYMSSLCKENQVNCKDLVYSDEEEEPSRRLMYNPDDLEVHTAAHSHVNRRRGSHGIISSGFCENDHGGPLVVGHGKTSTVVGIITACLTRDVTQKCYGPFLYTSVYKNRHLINCAIYKEIGPACRALFRTSKGQLSETTFDWTYHPDGPPKSSVRNTSNSTLKLPQKHAKNSTQKKHQ